MLHCPHALSTHRRYDSIGRAYELGLAAGRDHLSSEHQVRTREHSKEQPESHLQFFQSAEGCLWGATAQIELHSVSPSWATAMGLRMSCGARGPHRDDRALAVRKPVAPRPLASACGHRGSWP